jgi:hypothetical protein
MQASIFHVNAYFVMNAYLPSERPSRRLGADLFSAYSR